MKFLLAALNAKYIHSNPGIYSLKAYAERQMECDLSDALGKQEISVELGEYIPIEEIQSIANKMLRIQSLQPYIKNGYIKFNRKHKTLLKQLEEFPMGRNDDAPDGLQMAVALAVAVKSMAKKTEYKSVLRRAMRFGEGAY